MSLLRSVATVGGYTGISRIIGFLRDILIASVVGAGPVADAFFVAFKLPNLFRKIFAEGAFNAAFVPLFARCLEQEGKAAARFFAEQTLAVLVTSLLLLTVAAMAGMPWLMHVLAPGFVETPQKFELAIQLARITFPYLLFMSLTAFFSGVLNSLYHFAAAAAAPILLNIFFVASLLIVVPFIGQPGHVMAWTVAIAGIAQFLFVLVATHRAGLTLRFPWPRLTPRIKRLLNLMLPGILSAGVLQLNLVVGMIIASQQAGAVSFLYYADRVYQLPLGLIGIAFGVVLLPDLSRKLRSGAEQAAMYSLNRGLEMALLLTIPASVALAVIPSPIIIVLFERGALDREGSQAIAYALAAFASGLPAYVLVKILQPAFFAREDTVTPLKLAAVSVAVNIALSLALFPFLGHIGIALATAVAAWINTGLLALLLRRRAFLSLDERFRSRLPRILAAAIVMGALLWGLWTLLAPWFDAGIFARVAGLVLLVGGGLGAFAGLAFGFRAVERADLAALLGRRGGS